MKIVAYPYPTIKCQYRLLILKGSFLRQHSSHFQHDLIDRFLIFWIIEALLYPHSDLTFHI